MVAPSEDVHNLNVPAVNPNPNVLVITGFGTLAAIGEGKNNLILPLRFVNPGSQGEQPAVPLIRAKVVGQGVLANKVITHGRVFPWNVIPNGPKVTKGAVTIFEYTQ